MSDHLAPALRRNRLKRAVYFSTKGLFWLAGRPPTAMRTDLTCDGRPVLFLRAPKSAGTSLRGLLHTTGMTHAMPRHVLGERLWREAFSIAAVRHPFDRFVSAYRYHVRGPYKGALYRAHGAALKQLDPFGYLAFIRQYPEKLGHQSNWTCYTSARKPRADIVLRTEHSDDWIDQLTAAGLDLTGRRLERRNASRPAETDYAAVLGLSEPEVDRLRDAVHAAYACDYTEFTYDR